MYLAFLYLENFHKGLDNIFSHNIKCIFYYVTTIIMLEVLFTSYTAFIVLFCQKRLCD
jgi:hypothetical protein